MLETLFDDIPGNERVKGYLSHMLKKGYMGHTLLFAGPLGAQKTLFAKRIAQHLLKTGREVHPDLHEYHPEGKIAMHSIDTMRRLTEEVYLAPYQADCKVFLIHHAHRMLTYSANALLKTFEEPADTSILILLTNSPERLLPTIRSRCRTISFSVEREDFLSEEERNNPLRKALLDFLLASPRRNYYEIADFCGGLKEQLETLRSEIQSCAQSSILGKLTGYELNAVQRHAIEKEVEGKASLQIAEKAQGLLNTLETWVRDLRLIQMNISTEFLINKDYQTQLKSYPFGRVEGRFSLLDQLLSDARLGLQRSMSLSICLEKILLKIFI